LAVPSPEWKGAYLEALAEDYFDFAPIAWRSIDDDIADMASGKLWDGRMATTLWLMSPDNATHHGRVRLKNLSISPTDPLWDDPLAMLNGNFGYKLRPSSQGKKLGTLALSLALDKLAELGADKAHFGVMLDNSASLAAAASCGALAWGDYDIPSRDGTTKLFRRFQIPL
jgi:RimJ/RimL family protein N-acetyltransferase